MNPDNEIAKLKLLVLGAATPDVGLMAAMRELLSHLACQDRAHVVGALKSAWRALHVELHALDPVAYPAAQADCLPFLFRVTDERMNLVSQHFGRNGGWVDTGSRSPAAA